MRILLIEDNAPLRKIAIEELFAGKKPLMPFVDTSVFKRATKEEVEHPRLL